MLAPVHSVSNTSAANAPATSADSVSNANAVYYQQLVALQTQEALASIGRTNRFNSDPLLSADLLTLSPAALNILNGIEEAGATGIGVLGSTLAFTSLPPQQQRQLAAIAIRFTNAPLTQETFAQIQAALEAAGINPQEISIQQLLGAYNYAYAPAFALNGQLNERILASDLAEAA